MTEAAAAPAVRERPLMFKAEMVRAILAGTKTQTRRTMKVQPSDDWSPHSIGDVHRMRDGEFVLRRDEPVVIGYGPSNEEGTEAWPCPYGRPGDRIWVKETCFDNDNGGEWIYRADGEFADQFEMVEGSPKWTPSILCPRRAARIVLELTAVRVERLRSITGADCEAEGITVDVADVVDRFRPAMRTVRAVNGYRALWVKINGAGSWAANPWVWVLTFRRVTP